MLKEQVQLREAIAINHKAGRWFALWVPLSGCLEQKNSGGHKIES